MSRNVEGYQDMDLESEEGKKKVIATIKRILAKGHDAEVRKKKDGLAIYDVSKEAM